MHSYHNIQCNVYYIVISRIKLHNFSYILKCFFFIMTVNFLTLYMCSEYRTIYQILYKKVFC